MQLPYCTHFTYNDDSLKWVKLHCNKMIHKHGHDITRKVLPVDFRVTPKNCPRFSSLCASSDRDKLKTLPK